MKRIVLSTVLALLAACSQRPQSDPSDQSRSPKSTAEAQPTRIGFGCKGKEDDGNAIDVEKVTRHFVLEDGRLSELSDQTGKLEDACNGHPCRLQVTDAAINLMQGYAEPPAGGITAKTGRILSINRITGETYESWDTSFISASDGHTSEIKRSFAGSCAKEEPRLEIKAKF